MTGVPRNCAAPGCDLPLHPAITSDRCQLHRGRADAPPTAAAWPFAGLREGSYGAILADPPWSYAMRSDKGYDKSPEMHYTTMPEAAIAALPVARLAARDCVLWLWSTWPHLEQALRVMAAWGFMYRTGGAWAKRAAGGGLTIGTGFILRSASEPFLIGTRGAPSWGSKRTRNVIESELPFAQLAIDARRRQHSRKPAEARDMLQAMVPGVRCAELFGREAWPLTVV
jgi:N6-adenosine-specific RNA methylase IME4